MKFKVRLGFRFLTNANAVIEGNRFAAGVIDNPLYPGEDIQDQAAKVGVSSGKLKTALEKPKSATRTSDIAAARVVWETDMAALANMVELVVWAATGSDAAKIAMIQSTNMEIVGHGGGTKHTFSANRGDNSGEVKFDAEGDEAVAHLYTWSADLENFANKADPWTSSGAKTTATGVPKARLAFFHKGIYTKKRVDWQGPIFLTVL